MLMTAPFIDPKQAMRAMKPQGDTPVQHPPARMMLNPNQPEPPPNMIRDLLQRLRKQPTPVPFDGDEQRQPPMKSVLKQ